MSQNEKRPCVPDSTQGHFISWFCYWVLPHNTIIDYFISAIAACAAAKRATGTRKGEQDT